MYDSEDGAGHLYLAFGAQRESVCVRDLQLMLALVGVADYSYTAGTCVDSWLELVRRLRQAGPELQPTKSCLMVPELDWREQQEFVQRLLTTLTHSRVSQEPSSRS